MDVAVRRTVAVAGALVVPFLVFAPLIIVNKEFSNFLMPYELGGIATIAAMVLLVVALGASLLAGLAFLIWEFRWVSVYLAIIYVPTMGSLLLLWGIGFIGRLYGVYL